jgi:tetratricopeptide (TPR) repeat protein
MKPYFTPTEITLKEVSGANFKKLEAGDLTFVDADGVQWIAPKGTLTDGASVPRLALSVTDGRFEEIFLKAAVVHDAYCQQENASRRPPYQSRPWQKVHEMFYHACLAGGTPHVRAYIMFAAVYWFGPRWDDPEGEARQVPADLARFGFSGTKQWIEKEQPSVAEIEKDVAKRERAILKINSLQMAAIEALNRDDSRAAGAKLRQADSSIAAGLKRSPDDLMFLNLQGYQHKNWAMVEPHKKEEELNKAESLFKKVIAIEARDPSALNGLGSVAIGRADLDLAERFILDALAVEPDYPAALHDLALVRGAHAASRKGNDTG